MKRYTMDYDGTPLEDENGDWVPWEDYKRLLDAAQGIFQKFEIGSEGGEITYRGAKAREAMVRLRNEVNRAHE